MEAARAQGAEKEQSARRQERTQRPEREQKEQGREQKPEAGQGDPVARFKQAQKEFIQVAGLADFDPKAKMRAAEREGIAPQVRNFVRQAEQERGREKGKGLDRDEGLER